MRVSLFFHVLLLCTLWELCALFSSIYCFLLIKKKKKKETEKEPILLTYTICVCFEKKEKRYSIET